MIRLASIFLALALFDVSSPRADELRPAYLDIHESMADEFAVVWKVPALGDLRLGLHVRLPAVCRSKAEPVRTIQAGSYFERWSVVCDGGLRGREIAIDGLSSGVTDALARIEYRNGTTEIARFTPVAPIVVVAGSQSRLEVARTYLLLGIDHKLPNGSDDPLKVIFKLKNPNPRFALENFGSTLFGSFMIMPEKVWKGKDPMTFSFKDAIGTGPYKLMDATASKVTWVRDDNWWGAKTGFKPLPKPKQLIWQVVADAAASKGLLIANQLDAAREYSLEDFKEAKSRNVKIVGWDAAKPLAWNDPCPRQLDISTKYERDDRKPTPWKEAGLRKALSLLLDRKKLSSSVYGDTVQPSRTMFAEYGASKVYVDAVVTAGHGVAPTPNLPEADRLLQLAGYKKDAADSLFKKDGDILAATITVNADLPKDIEAANEIASQLVSGGVKARVISIPNLEYWGKTVPTGDYEMVYGWLSCGSVAEPYTSMRRYATKAIPIGQRSPGFDNTGRWDAPSQYVQAVENIGKLALKDSVTSPLVVQAYKILNDEMPFVPLIQSPKIVPFNTYYWTGWPAANAYAVPMHSWAATHRIIHRLKPN